jgi:putative acetyltransferase
MTTIRHETPNDIQQIHLINERAFEQPNEADLVDALRDNNAVTLSLVAELDGDVVGHILFSPMVVDDCAANVVGLGPMAVLPEHQRGGIGSQLVRQGLEECRSLGVDAVIVLGHPWYYPLFGFVPASRYGIQSTFDVPDTVFMAVELNPGALDQCSGVARYRPEFDGV